MNTPFATEKTTIDQREHPLMGASNLLATVDTPLIAANTALTKPNNPLIGTNNPFATANDPLIGPNNHFAVAIGPLVAVNKSLFAPEQPFGGQTRSRRSCAAPCQLPT